MARTAQASKPMAINLSLILSLIGSLALAGTLVVWADRVAGARLLAGFLVGVAAWAVGNDLPTWLGAEAETPALLLLSFAPLTAAVFLHFSAVFCAAALPRIAIPSAYAAATAAMLLCVVIPPGRFEPSAGVALLVVPNAVGWASSAVWAVLGACGQAILFHAALRRRGLERRQVAAVAASSAWGLLCMSGYAITGLHLPVYPWPLLLLPAYPVILVYAILRYRALVANAWARRAVAWALLAFAALLVVVLVPLVPLEGVPSRVASGWLVAAICLGLAGPARRLAERVVYPGGTASAEDLDAWRADLCRADDPERLASVAADLLRRRLGVAVGVSVGEGEPTQPGLACRRGPSGWSTEPRGWDVAPPGARRLAGLFGTVLAQEAERVERASALAARERDRQVEARLAELGQLAAAVAHDIRNPLNIIAMAAASAPPEVRGEVRAQVERIAHLSRDLLDYARPWRVEPVAVDLSAHVRAAARHYPGVDVGAGLDGPVPMRADPGRLDQVLANLMDNARATGARAAVEAEDAPDAVRVHVCDAGSGIPPEVRDRLFQPFASRSPGGTGLGLAIVARVMAAHGGRAALSERPGWSTCITLEFPR